MSKRPSSKKVNAEDYAVLLAALRLNPRTIARETGLPMADVHQIVKLVNKVTGPRFESKVAKQLAKTKLRKPKI